MERTCQLAPLTTAGAVARRSCSSMVPANGGAQLYLFGGVGPNEYYNDLHVFHVDRAEWSECRPVGTLPSPRGGCASCVVGERAWYVFGGRGDDGFCADMYALDLVQLGWTPVLPAGQSPSAREDAVLMAHGSHSMYLLGGCGASGVESDLWRFDCVRGHWDLLESPLVPYPNGLAAPCVAASEREVFLLGGYDRYGTFLSDLWRFSMHSETWQAVDIRGAVPRPRTHGQMALCDGRLLLYGGYTADSATGDVWQFTSIAHDIDDVGCLVVIGEEVTVQHGVNHVTPRGAATSAAAKRNWYVFGGCDGQEFLHDVAVISLAATSPNRLRHALAPNKQPAAASTQHPYHVQISSPRAETSALYVTPPPAPVPQPSKIRSSHSLVVVNNDGDLMQAITDLKAELFGPRLGHVQTILEENQKLREENAKLQQTVLDLMRKVASQPTGSGLVRPNSSALPAASFIL